MYKLALALVLFIGSSIQAQDKKKEYHLNGTFTATQNGIALIPSFSLSKPALLFDFNAGGRKLTFEPMFRFGTNARPWTFVFWWRYKMINSTKFKMSVGAHPSYVFNTITINNNGTLEKINRADRYFAFDLTPTWFFTRNTSAGLYYLQGRGLDKSSVRFAHFLTLNANFSNIKITGKYFANFSPQIYYLNQAEKKGYYYTHSLTLAREKFPFSIQSIWNKAIKTDIPGKGFVWNIGLVYNFRKILQSTTNNDPGGTTPKPR